MRLPLPLLCFFSFVGCNNGFKAASLEAQKTSSSLTDVPSDQTPPPAQLNASDADNVAQSVGKPTAVLLLTMQKLASIDLTQASQTVTTTGSITCAQGGSIAVSAVGNLTLNISYPTVGLVLSNGSSSLTFKDCAIGNSIVLNGTLSALGIMGSSNATLSASDANTFTASSSSQLAGSLQVSVNGVAKTCAFALSNSLNASGNFSIISSTQSGVATVQVSGSVCNVNVIQQFAQTF
jgi:hypothetical protein